MRFVFILFSLIGLLSHGFSNDLDSVRSEVIDGQLFVFHEVEEEETLYSIAKRYKSSVSSVIALNEISENRIEIGQLVTVHFNNLVGQENESDEPVPTGFHLVMEGETLYSISKLYDLKIKELRKLNDLKNNSISPGDYLRISNDLATDIPVDSVEMEVTNLEDSLSIPEGFEIHFVQTNETLHSIATKRNVSIAELKEWNELDSDYIRIGQTLLFKPFDEDTLAVDSTNQAIRLNEDGFDRVFEEGIVAMITDIETSKYLALHRTMPVGTELAVRNLMNNLVVHVKVVGKLPDTGINRNVLLRLSEPAYEKLGILDSRSRVEVSHFKQ